MVVLRFLVIGMGGISRLAKDPCGSELARDSGLSVDIYGECQSVIASKLAPTGFCGVLEIGGE
jgi:hypothetical protein